ncbi:MAG TPA: hypothetical protein VFQ85_09225 [Mycobacteriales bacterium]|jgi:hypothetical protein|nr:hypothetical protein [Mycobacteriales bacterium]
MRTRRWHRLVPLVTALAAVALTVTPAGAATAPAARPLCSGQEASATLVWGSPRLFTIYVPTGADVTIAGSADIDDRDWTGGWQTILYIDPVVTNVYLGDYYGGPYHDLAFSGSWTNYGSSRYVTLTMYQEFGSNTAVRFTATVSSPVGCAEPDSDGDHLSDATEARLGTDPLRVDTDGDGLLDPWEVPDSVPGSGFWPDGGPSSYRVSTAAVFGPRRGLRTGAASTDGRIPAALRGAYLNDPRGGAPDPLHRDVYVEIDYQDCAVDPKACPGIGLRGLPHDPMHHAPSLPGLARVQAMFERAGIRLHLQLDEAVAHRPNCAVPSVPRLRGSFGTARQRANTPVLAAKARAFRWLYSGHSTVVQRARCSLPSLTNFLQTMKGVHNLPSYDDTPFGYADAPGRTIVVSLSPLWACPRYASTIHSATLDGATCFRAEATARQQVCWGFVVPVGCRWARIAHAGVFPAYTLSATHRTDFTVPQSQSLYPHHTEREQVSLLWSRVFAHLLGQSLGIRTDAVLGNSLAPERVAHTPSPQPYASWDGLHLAPFAGPSAPLPVERRPPFRIVIPRNDVSTGATVFAAASRPAPLLCPVPA